MAGYTRYIYFRHDDLPRFNDEPIEWFLPKREKNHSLDFSGKFSHWWLKNYFSGLSRPNLKIKKLPEYFDKIIGNGINVNGEILDVYSLWLRVSNSSRNNDGPTFTIKTNKDEKSFYVKEGEELCEYVQNVIGLIGRKFKVEVLPWHYNELFQRVYIKKVGHWFYPHMESSSWLNGKVPYVENSFDSSRIRVYDHILNEQVFFKVVPKSDLVLGEFYILADISRENYFHKNIDVYGNYNIIGDYFMWIHRWSSTKVEAPSEYIKFKFSETGFHAYLNEQDIKYNRRWADRYLQIERRSKL